MTSAGTEGSQSETERDRIERLVREQGGAGLIAFIRTHADPAERRRLYMLAQRVMGGEMFDGDLDDFVDVVEAGIDEMLGQSETAANEEERRQRLDTAAVLAYCLAGCLADTWPMDERTRERRHLEAGLEAASLCVQWREELGKGPTPRSLAWWAKGIHLLSMGHVAEAEPCFARALALGEEAASEEGASVARDATGHWSVLLGWGFTAIARQRATGDGAEADAAIAALDAAIASRPDEADNLRFIAGQVRCARDRHARA